MEWLDDLPRERPGDREHKINKLFHHPYSILNTDYHIAVFEMKEGYYGIDIFIAGDHSTNTLIKIWCIEDFIELEGMLRWKIDFATSEQFWDGVFEKVHMIHKQKKWGIMSHEGEVYE